MQVVERRGAAALAAEKQATIDAFEAFFEGEAYPRWPLEVFLEVSNLCDLKCAMCGTFSAVSPDRLRTLRGQDRGFLEESTWASLEPVLRHALYVHAFGYGEPTIHPRFQGLLADLSRFEVMTDFFTNGMHLDPDLCEFLVDARVARVTVSFSGATREDYENVYLGGEFERVLGGLKRLADTRARARSAYPQIAVNSIAFRHHMERLPEFVDLMADHGVDEIGVKKLVEDVERLRGHAAPHRPERLARARRRARARGVGLATDQYERESARAPGAAPSTPIEAFPELARTLAVRPPDPEREGRVDVDLLGLAGLDFDVAAEMRPLGEEHFGTREAFHCLEPFKTLYVRRNGFVKPCCFAPDSSPALGRVGRASAEEVWTGAGFGALRDGVAAGHYSKPICGECIRAGTAPTGNLIRQKVREYGEWYADRFGSSLAVRFERDVPPARAILALNRRHPEVIGRAKIARPTPQQLAEVLARRARSKLDNGRLLRGGVDVIARTLIAGWVFSPWLPEVRWRVSVRVASTEREIASGVAEALRPDVAEAGFGDGRHGFVIHLPPGEAGVPGPTGELRVVLPELGIELPRSPQTIVEPDAGPRSVEELAQRIEQRRRLGAGTGDLLVGCVDRLTAAEVAGWVYCPELPGHHFTVEIRHDELAGAIAHGEASAPREDVARAGHGDGSHGFQIRLPEGWAGDRSLSPAGLCVSIRELGVTLPAPG